uniref:collagen alpha-1(I) chain-like n=1 Tax=Nyctereutes procyonoides TaxID=34880 RepID=UPI002443DD4D|nr:collagen alpha-1(I) chain-like [Nyctereutes procyonoides]
MGPGAGLELRGRSYVLHGRGYGPGGGAMGPGAGRGLRGRSYGPGGGAGAPTTCSSGRQDALGAGKPVGALGAAGARVPAATPAAPLPGVSTEGTGGLPPDSLAPLPACLGGDVTLRCPPPSDPEAPAAQRPAPTGACQPLRLFVSLGTRSGPPSMVSLSINSKVTDWGTLTTSEKPPPQLYQILPTLGSSQYVMGARGRGAGIWGPPRILVLFGKPKRAGPCRGRTLGFPAPAGRPSREQAGPASWPSDRHGALFQQRDAWVQAGPDGITREDRRRPVTVCVRTALQPLTRRENLAYGPLQGPAPPTYDQPERSRWRPAPEGPAGAEPGQPRGLCTCRTLARWLHHKCPFSAPLNPVESGSQLGRCAPPWGAGGNRSGQPRDHLHWLLTAATEVETDRVSGNGQRTGTSPAAGRSEAPTRPGDGPRAPDARGGNRTQQAPRGRRAPGPACPQEPSSLQEAEPYPPWPRATSLSSEVAGRRGSSTGGCHSGPRVLWGEAGSALARPRGAWATWLRRPRHVPGSPAYTPSGGRHLRPGSCRSSPGRSQAPSQSAAGASPGRFPVAQCWGQRQGRSVPAAGAAGPQDGARERRGPRALAPWEEHPSSRHPSALRSHSSWGCSISPPRERGLRIRCPKAGDQEGARWGPGATGAAAHGQGSGPVGAARSPHFQGAATHVFRSGQEEAGLLPGAVRAVGRCPGALGPGSRLPPHLRHVSRRFSRPLCPQSPHEVSSHPRGHPARRDLAAKGHCPGSVRRPRPAAQPTSHAGAESPACGSAIRTLTEKARPRPGCREGGPGTEGDTGAEGAAAGTPGVEDGSPGQGRRERPPRFLKGLRVLQGRPPRGSSGGRRGSRGGRGPPSSCFPPRVASPRPRPAQAALARLWDPPLRTTSSDGDPKAAPSPGDRAASRAYGCRAGVRPTIVTTTHPAGPATSSPGAVGQTPGPDLRDCGFAKSPPPWSSCAGRAKRAGPKASEACGPSAPGRRLLSPLLLPERCPGLWSQLVTGLNALVLGTHQGARLAPRDGTGRDAGNPVRGPQAFPRAHPPPTAFELHTQGF